MAKGKAQEAPTTSLAADLMKKPEFKRFKLWLVGDTPLITHAWSEKARREMLAKQVKSVKAGKEARDPQTDFVSSLYEMGEGIYGFPATGVKNCITSAAHKDKGVPRSDVQRGLWLDADMVRVRPALAGAICDVPLVRIWGPAPEMREDMVKIGSGLNKVASLAYRAQFTIWAVKFGGRYSASVLNEEKISFLIMEAGMACGIGEWRNEKKGMFGSFHLASTEEAAEWDAFADGNGKLPVPEGYKMAAE